jgi:NAD(P)-dependent dehydrogenase (short-subunit alcohol dehydrogenase family)
VCVVTGGARGNGRAIAEGLAARGDRVVVADVLPSTETVTAITDAGGTAVGLAVDIADEASVRALAAEVREQLGTCEILVNNAARLHTADVLDLDYATFRDVVRTNLHGPFLTTSAFLPDMVAAGWGRIVNVASSSLLTSTPGLTAYMASKGGVLGLTSAVANDVGRHGITVNAVSPGLTRTPGVDADIREGRLPANALAGVVAAQAIPRPGTAQDVVGAVLFLTSDEASFMTGQFLVADGGMTRH